MIRRLLDEQKPLMIAGAASLALFLILAVVSLFDATEIEGVNRWIKPMKFTLSPAIYLWTLAVYLHFIDGRDRAKRLIAAGVIATMAGEIALIVMQAARGTTSHFNVATGFDGAVFAAMGWMILVNTLLVGWLLGLYFRAPIAAPRALRRGLRCGLVLFLLASFEGGLMSAMLRHGVGVAAGGEGLPFVNWSTRGGDLRVAHFVGLHALQAVPFFAFLMERYDAARSRPPDVSSSPRCTARFSLSSFCRRSSASLFCNGKNLDENRLTRAARLVSIAGHPFVLLALTVFIAAAARDGAGRALMLGGATVAATVLPLLFVIRRRVARGKWSDHDVSVPAERRSFYPLALLVVAAAALVFALLGFPRPLVAGLGVSLALLLSAMFINRWTKISLHMIFAVYFAVALTAVGFWIGAAFLLLAAAVGWSRVRLARHTARQVAAGAALGAAGGLALLAVNAAI